MPHVFIIRITQEGEVTFEKYFLKTAKKPEEVLDRKHLKDENEHLLKMGEYLNSITSLTSKTNAMLDVYDMLHQISEDEKIDPEVKQEALRAISNAEAELQGGMNES